MRNRLVTSCLSILALASIAAAATVLTTSSSSLEGKNVAKAETTLGNLVADAVRAEAQGDLALVNASQIRAVDLPAGAITDEAISGTLAYQDEKIALVTLKGSKITACLERGLSMTPEPNKGFLQVSGMFVKFDSRRKAGERVLQVNLGGKALEPDKEYKAAMPLSLAKGAGGYFTILNGATVKPIDTTLLATVKSYLITKGTASAKADSPRLQDIVPSAQPK